MALSNAGDLLKPGMESVICDLCHSDQSEVVTRQRDLLLEVTNDEFTIVKCCRSGLVYLNPRASKDLLVFYSNGLPSFGSGEDRRSAPAAGEEIFCSDQTVGLGVDCVADATRMGIGEQSIETVLMVATLRMNFLGLMHMERSQWCWDN